MRPLQIATSPAIILGLQDEIRRSDESRYDHRLHGVLLVAQGMTCPEVARLLGDAPRSVEYWVRRFEKDGLAGLLEGDRPGRPRRLSEKQMEAVNRVLRRPPQEVGFSGNIWDGKVPAPPGRPAMPTDLPPAGLPLAQTTAGLSSRGFRTASPA